MPLTRKTQLVFILILWASILFGFIALKEFTVQSGQEVILQVRPVDPRDLFRGDYVILAYDISTLSFADNRGRTSTLEPDDTVYVALNSSGPVATAEGFYTDIPFGQMFIKGKIEDVDLNNLAYTVDYGIASFFVPEGQGKDIEQIRGDELTAKVVIDHQGNAILKQLFISGQPVTFD